METLTKKVQRIVSFYMYYIDDDPIYIEAIKLDRSGQPLGKDYTMLIRPEPAIQKAPFDVARKLSLTSGQINSAPLLKSTHFFFKSWAGNEQILFICSTKDLFSYYRKCIKSCVKFDLRGFFLPSEKLPFNIETDRQSIFEFVKLKKFEDYNGEIQNISDIGSFGKFENDFKPRLQ